MLGFPVSNSYLRIRRAKFTKILSKTDIVKPINRMYLQLRVNLKVEKKSLQYLKKKKILLMF